MKIMPFAVVFFCSILGGIAQILLKKGSGNISFSLDVLKNYWIIAGFGLYGIAFILYTIMLRKADVSVLYPIISLSYFWVVMLAWLFLHEPLSVGKVTGSLMIILGVALITL